MIFPVVLRFEVDADGRAYADFRRPGGALDRVDARVGVGARDEIDAWDVFDAHGEVNLLTSQNHRAK